MLDLSLHHVGIITEDLKTELACFPYIQVSEVIFDEMQQANIVFVRDEASTLIEFVEPITDSSPTHKFAVGGGGYHHVCYQATSLAMFDDIKRRLRLMQISSPVPATAMGGREVIFCFTRSKRLLEFVISESDVPICW